MIRPNLFLPCPPLPFSQNTAMLHSVWLSSNPRIMGRSWKFLLVVSFSSCPFVPEFIVSHRGSLGGACWDSRELTAEVEMSSIPFPFNHHSRLTQYQNVICIFIIAKSIRILPCLATACCICFLFTSNWKFGSDLTVTGSKGLFKYRKVLRKITA